MNNKVVWVLEYNFHLYTINLEEKELLIEKYKGYMDLLTNTIFEGKIKGLGVVILKKQ